MSSMMSCFNEYDVIIFDLISAAVAFSLSGAVTLVYISRAFT
jgi:hypothetical protein